MAREGRVRLGVIMQPHGVRGLVRIRSFTAHPADIAAYGPLTDAAGARRFALEVTGVAGDAVTARIAGIADRDAAEALRGVELFVPRDALPELEEEEYYHHDLIGLRAERADGTPLGEVAAVHDFGAGDMIEIATPDRGPVLLPFTADCVPEVDVAGGRLVVAPPPGLLEEDEEPRLRGGRREDG